MSLHLSTSNLTKRFGEHAAVNEVSLDFEPGLIHAVLGENGAGKSTLMKLLFGLHKPTSGQISIDGKEVVWHSSMAAIEAGLGMVQQHFSLVETLSAIDNIILGAETVTSFGRLNRRLAIERLESLLPTSSLAVPWLTPVQQLSVGERQRVEILKLLFREAKILFLDEPTAVLAPSEINEFFEVLRRLKQQGRTIVLITHKINEVLAVCDTYTVLRQGKLISRGRVAEVSANSIVESMIGRRLPEFSVDRTPPSEKLALSCENLHDEAPGRGQLRGISLHVHAGEIVGIAGVEGSGQSQFVETLMGLRAYEGEFKILGKTLRANQSFAHRTREVRELGTGYVPEDRHTQGLWLDESCSTNMIIGLENDFLRAEIFDRQKIEEQSSLWAREFDVRSASLEVPVGSLSGGNQQKVIFAREVNGRKPKLLICHQPTRGVDLGAIDLIHRRLAQLRHEGVGLLVLSSELDELTKLCDRIYVFFEGKITGEFARANFDVLKIGACMTGAKHA